MAITVFTNAFLIDCTGREPVEGAAVVVEGDRIKDVIASGRVGPLPGKYADLLVVDGNPLANLRVFQNTANLHAIVKGGVFVKRAL